METSFNRFNEDLKFPSGRRNIFTSQYKLTSGERKKLINYGFGDVNDESAIGRYYDIEVYVEKVDGMLKYSIKRDNGGVVYGDAITVRSLMKKVKETISKHFHVLV